MGLPDRQLAQVQASNSLQFLRKTQNANPIEVKFLSTSPEMYRWTLVLSTNKASSVRSRFDAAHELGHMLLQRNVPASWLTTKANLMLLEKQVHRFAGAFLLPEKAFAADVRSASLDSLLTLKMKWQVSVAAMCRRLLDIRMVSEADYSRLFRNLSRRGWRRVEPYDNAIPLERPYFLRRSFEVLANEGLLRRTILEQNTQLFIRKIQELVSSDEDWLTNLFGNDPENDRLQPTIVRFPQ